MCILGIDPGINGGMTILKRDGQIVLQHIMPVIKSTKNKTEYNIQEIKEIIQFKDLEIIAIEAQQPMPKQGVTSTFKIGRGMGILEGLCMGVGIPYILVRPRTWQKIMFKGMGKQDTKQLSKLVAQRLFPNANFKATKRCIKLHDGLTDSILIAEYIRKNY